MPRPAVRVLSLLVGLVLFAACRDGAKALEGTWERSDNPGQTLQFEAGRMLHSYPHGGKPIAGPYEVLENAGDRVVIEPTIELGDGKTLRADRQQIEFVDQDTLTMKNVKNGSGGTYKRKS
jgi:hypothetical protein